MSAAWLWARSELRRQWRSVVVLAVLAALAGGLAMAAATGARRSRLTVGEVMRERAQPDVISIPGLTDGAWDDVVALPYVEAWGLFASTSVCLDETGGVETPGAVCTQPPMEGDWFESIWRLDMLAGRLPTGHNEIVVNRLAQRQYDFAVGQRLHVTAIGAGRLDDYWNSRPRGSEPWGPTYEVVVVGVFAGEDAWRVMSGGVDEPRFVLPPAFIQTHRAELDYRVDASLRLHRGESDLARLRTDMARLMGPDMPLTNVHDAKRRVERSTLLESIALWAFAAALAAAAAVLVGQALVRLVRTAASDAPTLRAIGMSTPMLAVSLAAPGLAVAVLGSVGAGVVAVAASPRFPIGLARSFDRHPGVKIDVAVLTVGTVGTALLCAGIAFAAALATRPIRPASETGRVASLRRSVRPLPLPITFNLGTRWAFGRVQGEAVHVRPALVGVSVGVAAVVASFTMVAGIDDALAEPARGGKVWDLVVARTLSDEFFVNDPDVARVSMVKSHIVTIDGRPVRACVARPVEAPLDLVVIDGRFPAGPAEVTMGPRTAAALDVQVGDEVAGGPDRDRPFRVVGIGFLPDVRGHQAYDEGVWLTDAGLERIPGAGPKGWEDYLVKLRDGADETEFRARVARAGGVVDDQRLIDPAGVLILRNIRRLPVLLAGFLALLGSGTVGHTLFSTLRRRRRDLAVFRAMGLSRRQARAVVAWQATVLATVGIAIGVPLGIVGGQLAWRWLAKEMPLAHVTPLAALATLLVIPATVVLLNAVAAAPGRTATHAPPAAALRTE